jgi:hypothetical protein
MTTINKELINHISEKDKITIELYDINTELKNCRKGNELEIINKFFGYIGIEKRLKHTFIIEKENAFLKINLS